MKEATSNKHKPWAIFFAKAYLGSLFLVGVPVMLPRVKTLHQMKGGQGTTRKC